MQLSLRPCHCNLVPASFEESYDGFNGAHSQVNMQRIAAYVYMPGKATPVDFPQDNTSIQATGLPPEIKDGNPKPAWQNCCEAEATL